MTLRSSGTTSSPDDSVIFGGGLKARVEDFLAYEAELLDERQFDAWLDLLHEDIHYWMPIARNVEHGRQETEYTEARRDAAWFDEGKLTLTQRVHQIQGGDHWAEEPLSRSTHIATNIRIVLATDDEITVKCRFLVHVSRRDTEERLFIGRRIDVLAPQGQSFLIRRRSIFIDQSKLLAKSLTTLF